MAAVRGSNDTFPGPGPDRSETKIEPKDVQERISLTSFLEHNPHPIARLIAKNIDIASPDSMISGSDVVAVKNKCKKADLKTAPYFDMLLDKADLIELIQLEAKGDLNTPKAKNLTDKAFLRKFYAWMMTYPDERGHLASFLALKKHNQQKIIEKEKKLSELTVLELENKISLEQIASERKTIRAEIEKINHETHLAGEEKIVSFPQKSTDTINNATRGLDCTFFEVSHLMCYKDGLELFGYDLNLTMYGEQVTQWYMLNILYNAYNSVARTLDINTVTFHDTPLTWNDNTKPGSGVPEGVHVWLATKDKDTDKEKQFLCFAVRNKFNCKGAPNVGAFTREELYARLTEEYLALEARAKEINAVTSDTWVYGLELKAPDLNARLTPELILTPLFQNTLFKLLKHRGHLYSFEINQSLIQSMDTVRLNQTQFTEAVSYTFWGNRLTPYSEKLFYLATGCSDSMTSLSLSHYFKTLLWLGHPSLNPAQAIPAPIAINLYFQLFTQNKTAKKLFRGFVSRFERAKLAKLNQRDRQSLNPMIRFNDGKATFDEENHIWFFHRNLVWTDYRDKGCDLSLKSSTSFERLDRTTLTEPCLIKGDKDTYKIWGYKEQQWQLTHLGKIMYTPFKWEPDATVHISNYDAFFATLKQGHTPVEYHKLLFKFDAQNGVVQEATIMSGPRYIRRITLPPRHSLPLSPPVDFRQLLTTFNGARKASATSDISATDAPTAKPFQVELILERLSAAVCYAEAAKRIEIPSANPELSLCGDKPVPVEISHYGGTTYSLFKAICLPPGRTPEKAFHPLRGNRI